MKRQFLGRISVRTAPEAEDAVAELLNEILGLPASSYHDHETGVSTVTVYLPRKPESPHEVRGRISAGLKRIGGCGLNIGPGKIVMARVRWEDWAESWKRHFKPFEIKFHNRKDELCESPTPHGKSGTRVTRPSEMGKSLLIKPSWSKRSVRKGQAVIVLDPGLSFGTGHHPTTAFCLKEIVRLQKSRDGTARRPGLKPASFLDLGTGSGILAMAAAKLGYSPVLAMDFDPAAVRVARANARANHVHPNLKIRCGNVTKLPTRPGQQRQGYDLVCANLMADLLVAERRRITAQLNRGGILVLAGILRREFMPVQRAYAALGWKPVRCRNEQEWRSGSFRFGC
jgi:ribosomal protein L11 methyltransferase